MWPILNGYYLFFANDTLVLCIQLSMYSTFGSSITELFSAAKMSTKVLCESSLPPSTPGIRSLTLRSVLTNRKIPGGRGDVVGIATSYELDGAEFEPR